MALQERDEVPAFDDDELAVRHRCGIRGARTAVEQSDLAEDLAFAKDVKHDVLALGGGDADLDRAVEHAEQPAAGVALGEDHRAFAGFAHLHVRSEVLQHRRGQVAEQRMIAQQRQLVRGMLGRPTVL